MGSKQSTVDFIVDQIAGAGAITARKMFGEYGIYCDGKMTALVCDDLLFVKPTAAGKAFAGDLEEGTPYPNAKPHLLVDGDRWEDGDWLTELVRITAAQLEAPKPKAAKRSARPLRPR